MATPVSSAPKNRSARATTTVIGIDPSMTRTGICVFSNNTRDAVTCALSSAETKGSVRDSVIKRYDRLDSITAHVMTAVMQHKPDLVMIEGPSFASQHGAAHDRAGLWWMIVGDVIENGTPFAVVPPTCRMKYATGKGRADKDTVLAATIKRYDDAVIRNNDQADALIMAAMGMRHLGAPVEDRLPAINKSALDKIGWPS